MAKGGMEIQPCGAVGIVFNENGVIISGLQEILQMVVPEAEGMMVPSLALICPGIENAMASIGIWIPLWALRASSTTESTKLSKEICLFVPFTSQSTEPSTLMITER